MRNGLSLFYVLLMLMVGGGTSVGSQLHADEALPNIVYILADDLGIGDVGAFNSDSQIPMPNINRLAAQGMRFTDAHTNSGVCSPTRYGVLTGRYAWRTSMKKGVLWGFSPLLIQPDRTTVATLLKSQGYCCACFGKWHLGMDWPSTNGRSLSVRAAKNVDFSADIQRGPLDVGFEHYFGISGSLNMDPHGFIAGRKLVGKFEFLPGRKELDARGLTQPSNKGWCEKDYRQDQVLDTLADKTTEWIRNHVQTTNAEKKPSPFFAYIPLPSPHSPLVPSDRFSGKSPIGDYGDFCMETDAVVGRILKTLDDLDLTRKTLVIFTSDNGSAQKSNLATMQKQGHYPNGIYRGLKASTWEGGHRVPFIVRWPGVVAPDAKCSDIICTTDLLATCSEITAAQLADNAGEDSVSFLPALKGQKIDGAQDRVIVHHAAKGAFAVRSGKWKLHLDNQGGDPRVNPKNKPVENMASELLFDMQTDSQETTNVSAEHPEVVDRLKQSLAKLMLDGRSTAGPPQPNDVREKMASWKQLEPLREYLKK